MNSERDRDPFRFPTMGHDSERISIARDLLSLSLTTQLILFSHLIFILYISSTRPLALCGR